MNIFLLDHMVFNEYYDQDTKGAILTLFNFLFDKLENGVKLEVLGIETPEIVTPGKEDLVNDGAAKYTGLDMTTTVSKFHDLLHEEGNHRSIKHFRDPAAG